MANTDRTTAAKRVPEDSMKEKTMKVTPAGLSRSAGISAVVAGLLFVVIQPIHPHDTLASVTTNVWATIHYLTLAMALLFVVGTAGIYARQVKEAGWLGLAGVLALSLGLLITAAFVFVEAFIEPLLVSSSPEVVEGLLGIIGGHAPHTDLGALPAIYSISGALFLGGCVLFGIATFRARVLPRWAAALFAFGVVVSAPVSAALQAPRLTAVPIGLGLAWLGYALWSERRKPAVAPLPETATPQPDPAAA